MSDMSRTISSRRSLLRRCAAVLLAAALGGCSALPAAPPRLSADSGPPAATLYVIDRGWHTDIGFPANEVNEKLARVARNAPGLHTLVFGFGDRAYVLPGDKGFFDMLRALFPGPGMMLVTLLRTSPAEAFGAENVVTLHLSREAAARVQAFVWNDIQTDASGHPLRVADGPYPGSIYYASTATYAGYYTCNTWTADALASAGLPVSASGLVLAGQLMEHARTVAARQQAIPLQAARQ